GSPQRQRHYYSDKERQPPFQFSRFHNSLHKKLPPLHRFAVAKENSPCERCFVRLFRIYLFNYCIETRCEEVASC
ncbi:MAG: hypothetical protein LBL36_05045, partial [Clostridiales Family XIII bacterium]|nr:hypothetical protein [Clostridiales Family XIII bacterium]